METGSSLLAGGELMLISEEESLKSKLLFDRLIKEINDLIVHDFDRLVGLLYRLDVSEKKLKEVVAYNKGADAAPVIATLILERQAQKIRSRQEHRQDQSNISDEEKW